MVIHFDHFLLLSHVLLSAPPLLHLIYCNYSTSPRPRTAHSLTLLDAPFVFACQHKHATCVFLNVFFPFLLFLIVLLCVSIRRWLLSSLSWRTWVCFYSFYMSVRAFLFLISVCVCPFSVSKSFFVSMSKLQRP